MELESNKDNRKGKVIIINENTEKLRNLLESHGYTYLPTWPPKESGSCIVIDEKNYCTWKNIEDFLKIKNILRDEFNKDLKHRILSAEQFEKEIGRS